jgi:cytochrome c2
MVLGFGMVVYIYYSSVNSNYILIQPQSLCGVVDVQNNPSAYTDEQVYGGKLFQNLCSSCHAATDEIVVGPGLRGISKRRKIKWIVKWVNNPVKVLNSGDKYANELYMKYNRAMMTPFPGLKEKDIKAIIAYIDNK